MLVNAGLRQSGTSLFVIWDFALAREIPNNVSPIVHNLKDCPKGTYGQNRKNSFLQWRISETDRRGIIDTK
jgi:hypothetical protein